MHDLYPIILSSEECYVCLFCGTEFREMILISLTYPNDRDEQISDRVFTKFEGEQN